MKIIKATQQNNFIDKRGGVVGVRASLLKHPTATDVGGGLGIVGSLVSIVTGLFGLTVGLALSPVTFGISATVGLFGGGTLIAAGFSGLVGSSVAIWRKNDDSKRIHDLLSGKALAETRETTTVSIQDIANIVGPMVDPSDLPLLNAYVASHPNERFACQKQGAMTRSEFDAASARGQILW